MSMFALIADVGLDTVKEFFVVARDIVVLKVLTAGIAGIGMKFLAELL